MSRRKFWDNFWEHRCVTLDEDEQEEETAAATTEPECSGGHMTEEDYNEYSAMLDCVTEAALRDGRERTQRLRQRLRIVQERIKRHTDRHRSLHTNNMRITTTDKRTSTTDVDRVSSGSVEPDHTRVVYFKEEKAIQDKKGQGRRSREAPWDRSRGTPGDRYRRGSSESRPSREGNRRTSPHGPRNSRQGSSHSYHHLVHYAGVDVDSSDREEDEDDGEEEDEDNDDDVEETYVYSAEEDSEDDMAEPYVTHPYYAKYETGQPQGGELCTFTSSDCTSQQQHGAGSISCCGSSVIGMCVASKPNLSATSDAAIAAAVAAPASCYPTQPHQLSEASQKGHHHFTTGRWESLSPEEKI